MSEIDSFVAAAPGGRVTFVDIRFAPEGMLTEAEAVAWVEEATRSGPLIAWRLDYMGRASPITVVPFDNNWTCWAASFRDFAGMFTDCDQFVDQLPWQISVARLLVARREKEARAAKKDAQA